MCLSRTPPVGMGYLLKICSRIEPGSRRKIRAQMGACSQMRPYLEYAMGRKPRNRWNAEGGPADVARRSRGKPQGESPATDGTPKAGQRMPPGVARAIWRKPYISKKRSGLRRQKLACKWRPPQHYKCIKF